MTKNLNEHHRSIRRAAAWLPVLYDLAFSCETTNLKPVYEHLSHACRELEDLVLLLSSEEPSSKKVGNA